MASYEPQAALRRSDEPHLTYPEGTEFFSPAEHYPEYPFRHYARRRNPVYGLVRQTLADLGLDAARFGTPAWNPLGDWIKPGQRVFCLVNFVTNRRPGQSRLDFQGMLTHAAVIRPVLDYLIMATGDPQLVSFGNAPVQSAQLADIARDTRADKLTEFYLRETGVNVGPRDLRLYISQVNSLGYLKSAQSFAETDEVTFDLGTASQLEELPAGADRLFRVEDYGSDVTQTFHGPGRHLYKLHRQVLEADCIFHIPKLKTHGKVGLTGALKGAVGAIGRKECLAHHRRGGPAAGGDEFHTESWLTQGYNALGERTQMAGGRRNNLWRVAHKTYGRVLDQVLHVDIRGGWHGNDTAWRMALDINRCLRYGRTDGQWSAQPLRRIACLLDGIVAGEGDGPIHVQGRPTGLLIAAAEGCWADAAAALAMGFNPQRLPLVREAFAPGRAPLTEARMTELTLRWNGQEQTPAEVAAQLMPPFLAPRGWRGQVELARVPLDWTQEETLGFVAS